MFSFSLVANSFSLPYLDEVLRNIFKVFNSKVLTKEVQVSCNWLEKEMNLLNNTSMKNNELSNDNAELIVSNTDHELAGAKMVSDDDNSIIVNGDKNPFDAHFKKVFSVQVKHENIGQTKNPLYYPEAIEVLKRKWLPTVSFWTSLLLGKNT